MTYEELLDVKRSIEKLEHDMRGYNVDVHDYVTVEELVTAIQCIEKQIPEKPRIEDMSSFKAYCPICEGRLLPSKWCSQCGQAIDWSDEE